MASRLFQSVVGAGIALGVAQAGCSADVGDSGGKTEAPVDSILLAFCDAPWPTTKGAMVTQPPACDDPLAACAGAPFLRVACPSPAASATWACTTGAIFPACVGRQWVCPTSAWTCSMGEMRPPSAASSDGGGD
jgi:hypothetical protein